MASNILQKIKHKKKLNKKNHDIYLLSRHDVKKLQFVTKKMLSKKNYMTRWHVNP